MALDYRHCIGSHFLQRGRSASYETNGCHLVVQSATRDAVVVIVALDVVVFATVVMIIFLVVFIMALLTITVCQVIAFSNGRIFFGLP